MITLACEYIIIVSIIVSVCHEVLYDYRLTSLYYYLTVLKKRYDSKINPLGTAKLNTVAIRFPKHKIIRSILKNINFPLAMPSANKSSGVSPVKPLDVFEEFKNKIVSAVWVEKKKD